MRILVVAPFFPPDPAGSGVFAAQQAASLAGRGHEVLVVTNTSRPWSSTQVGDDTQPVNGVEVLRVRGFRLKAGTLTWNYRIPFSFLGLLSSSPHKKIRAFNPERIIVHSVLFDLSLWGLWTSWRRGCKSILIVHTALWHEWVAVRTAMSVYVTCILRPLIRRAKSRVVCVDDWTFSHSKRLIDSGRSLSVIPVSITEGSMRGGDGSAVRERFHLGFGPILLSLGHVVPVRDRLRLVRSLPLILEKHPALKLVVVGTPFDTRFLELAEDLGVRDRIILTGPVRHEEISDFLAIADVEAHDLDGRGLGITSIEAMDAGVPIVAWVNQTMPPHDQLLKYDSLALLDDGDPETIASMIDKLLTDKGFRELVVSTQRNVVREIFSEETATSRYLNLLTD